MSFIKCLQSKVNEGLLSKGQLKTLERKFDLQKERYTDTMGDADAANKAALDIMTAEANLIADKKRNTIKAALTQNAIRKSLLEKVEKGQAFDGAVRDLLEDTYLRKGTILKQYFSNMDKFADEYRSKFAGLHRRQDGIRDVVGELLGKNTGDAEAKQFSTAVRKTYEIANKRYKNAGGIMGDLENYHPTTHQKEAIEKVSFEKWYSDLEPRLDQSKMIDRETGLPFTRKKLLAEMKEDYDGIITNGRSGMLKDIESGKSSVGKSKEISNKRIASRFYMFKDADSFLEYNDLYGVGDSGLYDSIINHLESLARDTAILEKMGPKPNALMRSLDLEMLARDTKDFKRKWTNGMYQVLNGYVDSSVGEGWIFRTIGNTKNLLSAALLGAAPISAISDTAFVAATAKINGLSATRTLVRYAKLLNPASSKDRNLAKRSGYIADIARGSALADVRFTGENMGGKVTGWLAQFTNRASHLQTMTKAAADASSMELEATLAELAIAKTDWANVDKTFKDALELHGVTKDDWDIIKKADVFSPEEGVSFLRSQDLLGIEGVEARRLLDVGNKIDDFSQSLRMVATNEPALRTRAINTGAALGSDARRGTAIRGLSATFLQFKSFPMTVMFNHMIPSIKSAKQGKFGHAAYTFAGASILGGAALMLKDIVKGRDPRDPNDPRFWGAAVLQGGGLGIFGDFLFGRSELADAIGGPVVGLAEDVRSALVGNLEKLADDPTPKTIDRIKRDAFNLARRNIPASTLWYSRLVVERYILDQLEEMVDPDYQQRVRRLENRMINQTGQEYFWRKGETSPDRGPQITEK
tara:strand:- start:1053 stop:3494 length:2442 start_codon:yes stop_codon:yes gene_type:complete